MHIRGSREPPDPGLMNPWLSPMREQDVFILHEEASLAYNVFNLTRQRIDYGIDSLAGCFGNE